LIKTQCNIRLSRLYPPPPPHRPPPLPSPPLPYPPPPHPLTHASTHPLTHPHTLLRAHTLSRRLSPIQKALVIRLMMTPPANLGWFKRQLYWPPVTLAIGDGANDVPMIQEAHVSFFCFFPTSTSHFASLFKAVVVFILRTIGRFVSGDLWRCPA
jgi:hypothetical protein